MPVIELDIRENGVVHTLSVDTGSPTEPAPEPAPIPDPEPAPVFDPDNLKFYRTFGFVVPDGLEWPEVLALWQANGWDFIKTNSVASGARGVITTELNKNGVSVMLINPRPDDDGIQTDVWVGTGETDTVDPETFWPADAWIQMKVENIHTQERPSWYILNNGKFIYPANELNAAGGMFPGHPPYIIALSSGSWEPYHEFHGTVQDSFYFTFSMKGNNDASFTGSTMFPDEPEPAKNLGPQDVVNGRVTPNEEVVVTFHIDVSGDQGIFEQWMQREGQEPVKVAEWIGGVTPGFTWDTTTEIGIKQFRMPTTVNDIGVAGDGVGNYWMQMEYFAIGSTSTDLPYPV